MPKILNVRGIPDAVHRRLKRKAPDAGMPLSAYLISELAQAVERPALADPVMHRRRFASHKNSGLGRNESNAT